MTKQELTSLRLSNQKIIQKKISALGILEHMGAMQGQDYNGALWSIGLRTGLTKKEILKSIDSHEILRTWPQRGTLHFVPAEDAKWMVGLSAEKMLRSVTSRHERLSLNDKILLQSKKILTKALSGGKVLSRPKIMELLKQSELNTDAGRGYHTLWYLSQTGILIAGSVDEKQQTFALLDEWVKSSNNLTREESINLLTKRYFTSHGPATIQDFMWWSGLTTKEVNAALDANKKIFVCEKVDGKDYWLKKGLKAETDEQRAYLLPGFDEYMLGYKDRTAALPTAYANIICPGGNGMFLSTIVINGQVVGTWKKVTKKDGVLITLTPFKKLNKVDMKLLEKPAEQYGRFLGLKVHIKQ